MRQEQVQKMTSQSRKSLQRRHIEAIVAIGDLHSVHRAALQLGVRQPALSRILAEAERMLGVQLFERSSHGSRPTAPGETVLAQARLALRSLERFDDALTAAKPTIKLGCIPRAMHTVIPRLLEAMDPAPTAGAMSEGINFRFDLTEGGSTALLEQMRQGSLDFAILRSGPAGAEMKGNLVFEHLYSDRIVIICAASNQALPGSSLALNRLARESWVLPASSTNSRLAFDQFWSEQDLPLIQPLIEVRSFETNLALVASTRFLSIAPESIVRAYSGTGGVRVLKVRPAPPSSPVMLAFNPVNEDNGILQRFRRMIHEAADAAQIFV
jgi:DNA-binding transcriptional LysR family regulator